MYHANSIFNIVLQLQKISAGGRHMGHCIIFATFFESIITRKEVFKIILLDKQIK